MASMSEALKRKAEQMRNKTKTAKPAAAAKSNGKKSAKKSTAKKTEKKQRTPRIEFKDGKGKIVTGRDNSFTCTECKPSKQIQGPWSYKTHLVKVHGYSRKQAGLRPEE